MTDARPSVRCKRCRCVKRLAPGRSTCWACRRSMALRYAMLRDYMLCRDCKRPLEGGSYCPACRERHRLRTAAYRARRKGHP